MSNIRMLIINPNTSTSMTDSLKPMIENLGFQSVNYTYFTCPTSIEEEGISSINSPTDALKSAKICLPFLIPLISQHDTFLIACYSQHPLVSWLKNECQNYIRSTNHNDNEVTTSRKKYVTGIFESSIITSLSLLGEDEKDSFGIISTGKIWEEALNDGVKSFGLNNSKKYLGCETTGLNATELHDLPFYEVKNKMMNATERLLKKDPKNIKVICLGCAGMVGLDDAVRTSCIDVLGNEKGKEIYIIDGVKAGIGLLYSLASCKF